MQNDEQAVTPELQRLQLVMQALSAQRTQAEDNLALASAEITMLTTALKTAQAKRDEAKALAKTTLETAHALCRAYDNALVGNADGCPNGDAEVAELRAKLGYQD